MVSQNNDPLWLGEKIDMSVATWYQVLLGLCWDAFHVQLRSAVQLWTCTLL